MNYSKIFFYFCLSFLGGIFISSFLSLFLSVLLVILIFGTFSLFLLGKTQRVIIAFCILFLLAGVWRHQLVQSQVLNNELRKYNDSKEKITFLGTVNRDPDLREKISYLVVKVEKIEEELVENGQVLVISQRYPQYQYGDRLKIKGYLKTPFLEGGFHWADYLQKDGIYSISPWPKIEILERGKGNPFLKILFNFKKRLKETAQQFISPPQEGILEALIFGQEGGISSQWKKKLNITGTRHIAAVSGMNITIISSLIFNFFLFLGLWRRQAFYLSIIFILLYIFMIGLPSSALRAAIMGISLMTAQYFGRLAAGSRLVVFAASLMLLQNPLLLKADIGFQLSFLAILGIIHFQPLFHRVFQKIPNPKYFPARTTLAITFSAQTYTFPILIYNFGYLPLVSPFTNLLIVPFLAPITVSIFIFGFLGMVSWFFGLILSWPNILFLSYITKIVDFFSKFSFASLFFEKVHWLWLIFSYFLLIFLTFWLKKKNQFKFSKI